MATLQEYLDEMARIKNDLQRMESDESVTEEEDGDLRDTLVSRWQELDTKTKPLIERMEKIRGITRMADDEANLERPDGATGSSDGRSGGSWRDGSADLGSRGRYRNPYEDLEAVRGGLVRTPELRGRALDAIEAEARRSSGDFAFGHDEAEAATQLIQRNAGHTGRGIAEHILQTGSPEYQERFRAYMQDPQGEAARAALSLTLANGGYLLPFVLDQVPVA